MELKNEQRELVESRCSRKRTRHQRMLPTELKAAASYCEHMHLYTTCRSLCAAQRPAKCTEEILYVTRESVLPRRCREVQAAVDGYRPPDQPERHEPRQKRPAALTLSGLDCG